ncbi:Maf family protein [uncultured Amnibacterium sp.]|uniref:Maf family protein n=1 Tax=uncultured Amnibacterium sp. TaxID=1631851 RepID=UPI0035C99F27
MRLILASTSPARLALLRAAGVEPEVVPSAVDEPATVAQAERVRGRPLTAAEMVLLLARAKAEAVSGRRPAASEDALLLGGDSAFELDGAVYGKPGTAAVARERWIRQRGRTGVLYSGHWLIDLREGAGTGARLDSGRGKVTSASVQFAADLTDAEIDAYVATGEPLAVAGAFTIDSLGGPFIERIEGDPSTVVGLSLPTLRRLVRACGVEWTDLWSPRRPHDAIG